MTLTLKKVTLALLGLFIATTLAGCAGSSSRSPSASAAPPANVAGTWQGGTTTGAATYTMILKQTGNKVTGTLTGAGTQDGPIEGTVNGNTVVLKEDSGYGQTPMLNVKGDMITGIVRGTTLNMRRIK